MTGPRMGGVAARVAGALGLAMVVAACSPAPSRQPPSAASRAPATPAPANPANPAPANPATAHPGAPAPVPTVGILTTTFTDPSRVVQVPGPSGGLVTAPRTLVTVVRYPARGSAPGEVPGAPPQPGGHPLVVFAHGYDASPATYAGLLDAWARAGFVVAAPIFPLTSDRSPRLDPHDILNEPADVRLVISSVLAASRRPGQTLSGLIDPRAIAVAGHSDGAEAMAAVAFDTASRDARVRAAVIMAGAELPMAGGAYFAPGSPPLLEVEGTADRPAVLQLGRQLFQDDPGPKFLLELEGGTHLSPVSGAGPDLAITARVTIDFLQAELRHPAGTYTTMERDGNVVGLARLSAQP